MLEFIKEHVSVWDRLKNTDKKIVLYGMGNGADKILDWCEANHVVVSGIFASDEFVRRQNFRGYTVCSYSDIIEELGTDILIVIAFASERAEVLARFKELAATHETVAPHLPLFQDEQETVSLAWLEKYAAKLEFVYQRLADDQSRKVFADILNYKLSGKTEYLFDCVTERNNDLRSLFSFTKAETYLDLGAYNGDTVQEFLALTGGSCKEIIAVEPDRRNFAKLEKFAAQLDKTIIRKNAGVWDECKVLGFSDEGGRQSTFLAGDKKPVEVDTVDNICAGHKITYIKMDVEGAEHQALRGGKKLLTSCRPKMLIAAYHYDNDIFSLPLTLWEICSEYKIYLRKHPYIPAWEINFFAKIQ